MRGWNRCGSRAWISKTLTKYGDVSACSLRSVVLETEEEFWTIRNLKGNVELILSVISCT